MYNLTMVEVYKNLFIGKQEDYETNPLYFNSWGVVHACKEPYHRNLLGYTGRGAPKEDPRYLFGYDLYGHLVLNMVDCDRPEFFADTMIDEAIRYVLECLKQGKKVLIHCNQGESRAPSIALMILRKINAIDSDFNKAIEKFRSIYSLYKPANGIYEYIKMRWNKLV